jgi:hypothetical protein
MNCDFGVSYKQGQGIGNTLALQHNSNDDSGLPIC